VAGWTCCRGTVCPKLAALDDVKQCPKSSVPELCRYHHKEEGVPCIDWCTTYVQTKCTSVVDNRADFTCVSSIPSFFCA
jgi:hypothetical protein